MVSRKDSAGQYARFNKCEEVGSEAERLLDEGYIDAACLLFRRIATCVFGPSPCPLNSGCAGVVERLAGRLGETVAEDRWRE